MGLVDSISIRLGLGPLGRAWSHLRRERYEEAAAALDESAGRARERHFALVRFLLSTERAREARYFVERARKRWPDDVDALALCAEVCAEMGDVAAAVSAQERVVEARTKSEVDVLFLAHLYDQAERHDDVARLLGGRGELDADAAELYGVALFATDRAKEAVEPLRRAVAQRELRLKLQWSQADRDRIVELNQMLDDAIRESHGAEEVVWEHLRRGNLAVHAGVNHKLLAKKLMLESRVKPLFSKLPSVLEMSASARDIGRDRTRQTEALLLRATVALRTGRLPEAVRLFEEFGEAAPASFVGPLGVGAARTLDERRSLRAAKSLPELAVPGIERVVPDWPALTELERRVVAASVHPLRGAMRALAAAGARIRILPIDARATDLPEFAELVDERSDDHRSYHALEGLAGAKLAMAKIEELLEVDAEGWTFAHEFSHLVHRRLPASICAEIERLFRRATRVAFASGAYQLKNAHEFFAVSYTDHLCRKYELESGKHLDDAGVNEALHEFFSRLDALDEFGGEAAPDAAG